MKHVLKGIAIFAAGLALAAPASAQDYPTQPIRIIVGYAPGGGNDILARLLAPKMAEALGQNVVVENRPGAGGNIGAQAVAGMEGDGYTLMMANNSFTINPFIYKDLGFDVARDFETISLVATAPMVVVAHPDVGVSTLQELIDHAKANPGDLNYGSPGIGTPQHLATELFLGSADLDIEHIPFGGTGPSVTALLQNEIQVMFATPASIEQHVQAGSLRALAVTSDERSAAFPDVPTVGEAGLEGYEMSIWWGLVGPSGLPENVRDMLNEAVVGALGDSEVTTPMTNQGLNPRPTTPAEFTSLIEGDLGRWEEVVKQAGIEAQ